MPLATAKKERFGKFVLLEQTDHSGLGSEYRAAKLSPTGLEKIVTVLRLGPAVSSNPETAKNLMDQAKVAAQLQNPNVVKIFGIGKVDAHYYISYEFIEGKSLKAIFQRCKNDGFPFSVDHTLLIASKVCSALEYAHARKTEAGARYTHGLVTPGNVVVSYEGEVRLRGFGYWPSRIREAGALGEEELLYLAPEQAAGGAGDTRSDIFAVGALLFESLAGQPLFKGGRTQDVAGRIQKARLQNPAGEDDALPKPIADILQKALAVDPGLRYAETQEMRKAIDTLLFSGDFTPTTFNLAFFMHSLFREEIERESKLLKEEKEASYFEFLAEEPKPSTRIATPTPVPAALGASTPTPVPGAVPVPLPATVPVAATPLPSTTVRMASPTSTPSSHTPVPGHAPTPTPSHGLPIPRGETHYVEARDHGHREAAHPTPPEPPPGVSAKEAAAGFTFHKGKKSRAPLLIVAGVVVAGFVAVFLIMRGGASSPSASQTPATLTPEQRIAQLEEEKRALEARAAEEKRAFEARVAEAEAKAAEEAKQRVEAESKAKGQQADPAAVAKAQEEAARKARLEQEKRQEEERRRAEDAQKAEEARLAEEKRKAEEAARVEEQRKAEELRRVEEARAAAATTLPAPPPTVAVKPGSLVNLSDPGVISPVALQKPNPPYPEFAKRQRIGGAVELNILVDERGNVVDAQIVSGTGGKVGLNEAAQQGVRRWKYRPGTKDGVPVRVWMPVKVVFTLEK